MKYVLSRNDLAAPIFYDGFFKHPRAENDTGKVLTTPDRSSAKKIDDFMEAMKLAGLIGFDVEAA